MMRILHSCKLVKGLFFFLTSVLLVIFTPIRYVLRHPACGNLLMIGTLILVLSFCAGCAAIIDHKPRACYRAAVTVEQMAACTEEHKPWRPGLTDTIAQPILSAERAIREHTRKDST